MNSSMKMLAWQLVFEGHLSLCFGAFGFGAGAQGLIYLIGVHSQSGPVSEL